MRISRRRLLQSGAAATAAAPLVGATDAATASGAAAPRVTGAPATLGSVLRRGTPGPGGYAPLVRQPGEPYLVRSDLGVRPERGRARRRTPLIAFAQISDVHVVDAQSPLRVEWTDRFEDPGPTPALGVFGSAYRPHEMLSGHVADAMVQAINAVRRGPVTGKPLALVMQTGDNSDNCQHNEVRWNIDVLDGATVRVDSGDQSRWEGVADDDTATYDPTYWHPEPPPAGVDPDHAKTRYGFPSVPGLLAAARRPFRAAGLDLPWYTAFGNHDGLTQGNFPHSLPLSSIATGSVKVISPAGFSPGDALGAFARGDAAGLIGTLSATPGAKQVTPDPDRRVVTKAQIVEEHFHTSGLPVGHGFTAANRRDGTTYYTVDKGLVRFIVLDTVNDNGYDDGSLDQAQFTWLQQQLHHVADRYVVVCSHHTSATMDNPLAGTGADAQPRVLGPQVVSLLLAHSHVIAWINGHTHHNAITPHRRPDGGGFWEINSASHIDWPVQSRLIEVVDNHDGTLSIFTTVLDHAGPETFGGDLGDSLHLASLARELAANDWQDRTDTRLGTPADRNTELLLNRPRKLHHPGQH